MRDVKLGVILDNACRLAGRDPAANVIPDGWKVLAGMAIEAGLHSLAAEKFPLMQRVEFRRYRPDWTATGGFLMGHEAWHNGCYWRLEDPNAGGEPGVADGWRPLQPQEVARFIAFDQPWEATVMQSFGVDTTRFAYASDPRYNPDAAPLRACRLCELGVVLPDTAPDGVFVRFIPEFPRIDFADWSDETDYSVGDAAYDADSKDVFRYVGGDEEQQERTFPSDAWIPVRVRSEFASYLTRLVACDFLTEDQGKYQSQSAAEREFNLLCERYHEGNGETRIRTGRFCR
jgi:hypothetical protein